MLLPASSEVQAGGQLVTGGSEFTNLEDPSLGETPRGLEGVMIWGLCDRSMVSDTSHGCVSDFRKYHFFEGKLGIVQVLTRQYLAPNLLPSLVVFQRNPK